jgi:predicted AlkP superfamily pyrophosphatase or phosphodiesterase
MSAGLLLLAGACSAAAQSARLVLISVDGLRPDAINPVDTPHMAALRENGASAETALNDLPSATLPNHATMLTGVVSDLHGVNINFDTPGLVPVETLFDYAAAAGRRSEVYVSKSKLDYLAPPGSVQWVEMDGDTAALTARCAAQIHSDGPEILFLHLRDPDSVGHVAGWMSAPYIQAVRGADALVGQMLAAIAADSSRPTYVILTADHGGDGLNHGLNIPENRRIPWIVNGPDVPAGQRLTVEVTTADTTPTALWLLGLEVPPGLSGRALTSVRGASELARAVPVAPVGLPCVLLLLPPGVLLACVARRRVNVAGPRRSQKAGVPRRP